MSSNTAPKVGDTVSTYEELRKLPEGTTLSYVWNLGYAMMRFVQHDDDTVQLLDRDGFLRSRVTPEHPIVGSSYIVKSIPETDPNDADIEDIYEPELEPEPELELVARWMALHTVHTIEAARLLVQAGRDAGMSPEAIERAAHRHVLGAAITICRASQRPPRPNSEDTESHTGPHHNNKEEV